MQRVKSIVGTCRSIMQQPIKACTRAQTDNRACPCATCIWLLYPAPTSSQDGLDPLQLVLVVFLSETNTKTKLTLMVDITCNLHRWCFLYANLPIYQCTQAHMGMHCNLHCVWWRLWFVVVVVVCIYMCVCVFMCGWVGRCAQCVSGLVVHTKYHITTCASRTVLMRVNMSNNYP